MSKLKEIVELELPHIKYVIDCLEKQGLCAGALPEIYGNLRMAIEEVSEDARRIWPKYPELQ